ncbi:MAG: histidine kinase [Bacteroidota bacterium]
MKKLFVHHPLFRLLSPLFSGALTYLLILLINNTLQDLGSNFFTQELYVCIVLAYIIQESARINIQFFNRLKRPRSFLVKALLHLISILAITVLLVIVTMYSYFVLILSYTPNYMELLIFSSIFSTISVIYVLLYIGNQFLFKINTDKLEKEESERSKIESDFKSFKQEINPQLLFESLEAILALMKKDAEEAEVLTENFASIYRYLLSKKRNEIIHFDEELSVLKSFIGMVKYMPYRKLKLGKCLTKEPFIVPGSLLYIFEMILKSTIPSEQIYLVVDLEEKEDCIEIKYEHQEKLNKTLKINDLEYISKTYESYSSSALEVLHGTQIKTIKLPKLQMK